MLNSKNKNKLNPCDLNFKQKGFNHRAISICLLIGICCLLLKPYPCLPQEDLEALKDKYFAEYNYAGFIDYLKDLRKKGPSLNAPISFYIALSRYNQLSYLEESQSWDEYFSFGNNYRDELVKEAEEAISLSNFADTINLYAHCLIWQFHKDQEDAFVADALNSLMNSVREYSGKKDDFAPVKYIADKLYSYGNKRESKELYNIYVGQLLKAVTKDEQLKEAADSAYGQGNLSLSAIIYDAYIDRVIKSYPKEKAIIILTTIAKDFAYKDEGNNDPEYAEGIFKKVDELSLGKARDEQASYIRAYNLEKARIYSQAQEKYATLIEEFPQTSYRDEALFKCAIITTYVLRDIDRGVSLFGKLADSSRISPHVISSIYQLGLLSQWRKDFVKAKEYYARLMELSGDGFGDTRKLAEERLEELEKDGEIEYNLKMFLDASLKDNFDMSKIEIKSHPYRILKDSDTHINAGSFLPESGCMSVEAAYLWSGHLGTINPLVNQPELTTSYIYPGTKEINLVLVTANGIMDRSIDMVDVE